MVTGALGSPLKWRVSAATISMSVGVATPLDDAGTVSVGVAAGGVIAPGVDTGSLSVGVAVAMPLDAAVPASAGVATGGVRSSGVATGPLAQPNSNTITSTPMSDVNSTAFQLARILQYDVN